MNKTLRIVGALLLVALIGWVVYTIIGLVITQQESRTDRADLRENQAELLEFNREIQERLENQRATSEALAQQVEGLGEEPVVEPRDAEQSGTTAPRATPSPVSEAAVVLAVQDLIGSALEAVCDGSCEGERGEPGESIKGDPGESIKGDRGEPGQSIKGDKGDKGDRGDTGATGERGPVGRGIAFIACSSTGMGVVTQTYTYTDGTTETVTCDVLPPVDPGPDPEPTE